MKTTRKIVPVILAGGSGTRLWPLSRKNLPKQFARISNQPSLFQQTVQRTYDRSLFGAPIIVASQAHHSLVLTQLAAIGVGDAAVILEPEGRDTAAAIALAIELHPHDDSLMLVLPSDHHVGAPKLMEEAVREAAAVAGVHGAILTFGIKPNRAETGFGYLRCGARIGDTNAYALENFIEKPDAETARRLCAEPAVLWNAGIFLFERQVMRREFETLMPQFVRRLRRAVRLGSFNSGSFAPHPVEFAKLQKISVDYAVMEKTGRAAVIPVDPQWSDMGTWNSVWEIGDKDADSNCESDNVFSHGCSGSLAVTDGPAIGIAGLKDIVVVANRDAVLVASRTDPQGVKHVVAKMAEAGHGAIVSHPGETRPWGSFASLDRGSKHQVKRIEVVPGGRLSLQYHFHRAEHWVVVSGMATVTVDDAVMELGPCQQVFIPQGAVHRLENRTSEPVEIIEVQYGDYLGEDDIVRVEDVYGRNCETAASKTAA